MNIQMQLAGLGILVVLLCFYLSRKTVGLYTEIIFKWAMVIIMADVIMDILSIVAIVYRESLPAGLCDSVCKLYLIFLILSSFCSSLYICQDIYRGKARIHVQKFLTGVAVVGIMSIILLPIYIYAEEDATYTYGASVMATYGFCFSFVLLTLGMMISKRRRINPARAKAVGMWLMVWLFAAVIQFFFSKLLLVGYGGCIGMMILYFKLENPEANIDRLTGVFNTHALYSYMEQLYGSETKFSVLLVRLENFGTGGKADDGKSLLEMARFLDSLEGAKVFKNIDSEFVLVFEKEEALEMVTDEIIEYFDPIYNPVYVCLKDSKLAESVDEICRLLRHYKQLYQQKDIDGILEINEHMVLELHQEMIMVKKIVDALKDDRVELFLQPIYSVKKRCFTSAEALARIRDTDGSIISPGLFIPVAEKYGLVGRLGERMFEKVCCFIQRERTWEWGIEYIEVNLSVRQCESHTLAEHYKKIMDKYRVHPTAINLEVTESASIQKKNVILQNMERLIKYGVSFSLDDFGSGESNLNYIVEMPVDIVKFDREMTRSYFETPKGKLVMETAMRMILALNLKIVAEGVETKEQLAAMERLGVQYIQGFYFSKPLPEKEFVDFVKLRRAAQVLSTAG